MLFTPWRYVSRVWPFLVLATISLLVAFTLTGAQTTSESAHTLTETVQRELRAGEAHRYKVDLKAGEFVNVIADQHGIDVLNKQVLALMSSEQKTQRATYRDFLTMLPSRSRIPTIGRHSS